MGGPGSGRHAIALAEKKSKGCIGVNANISWRVIGSTLAQAEKDAENGKLPPSSVIDLAKWAIEMRDGKPTQKVDANVAQTVTLDPSLLVKAMRELDTNRAAFMLNSGAHATGCEETTSENVHSATSAQQAEWHEVDHEVDEVGWPGASPLRNVSSPPEKLLENGGGI